MQSVWREVLAGWKDARWSLYFGILLLPAMLAVAFIAYAIEGKVSTPPSALTWVLAVPAILVSLVVAGIWDGPGGRLGKQVWSVLFPFIILSLARRAVRAGRETEELRFEIDGQGFILEIRVRRTAAARETLWPQSANIAYQWIKEGERPDGGVLTPG